jgi:hypothetical protein
LPVALARFPDLGNDGRFFAELKLVDGLKGAIIIIAARVRLRKSPIV